MASAKEKISAFLSYWYFRYTLVLELYMVERWERIFINILLCCLFLSFFVYNYTIFFPLVSTFFTLVKTKEGQPLKNEL